jgi:hypothetical protein
MVFFRLKTVVFVQLAVMLLFAVCRILNLFFDQLSKNVDPPLHVTPDSLLMTNDHAGLVREPPFITPTPPPPRALEEKFLGLLMFCILAI